MEEEGEIEDNTEPVCKFINRGPPFAKALDGEDHWDGGEAKPVEGPEPPPRARSPGDDRRPPPRFGQGDAGPGPAYPAKSSIGPAVVSKSSSPRSSGAAFFRSRTARSPSSR